MCMQANGPAAKQSSTSAFLMLPQFLTPGQKAGESITSPEFGPDPMTRWLRELPRAGPWHGLAAPASSGQNNLTPLRQWPAVLSCTGATTGGEEKRTEVH
ncbi:hypothetical protein J7T55_007582 [Diaporthe amygdali]|uniref:uncharacterized protein n=1 Tax=Phomopsis amygdali TaxID=1214568 RepID=UPI0022FDE651|nr:uncharacterized protein J7T55_007582 [Diaporthe amygdali]KAJ0107212.1 hypothetical protein J7T55_007582 [Diaporthe amygdali]